MFGSGNSTGVDYYQHHQQIAGGGGVPLMDIMDDGGYRYHGGGGDYSNLLALRSGVDSVAAAMNYSNYDLVLPPRESLCKPQSFSPRHAGGGARVGGGPANNLYLPGAPQGYHGYSSNSDVNLRLFASTQHSQGTYAGLSDYEMSRAGPWHQATAVDCFPQIMSSSADRSGQAPYYHPSQRSMLYNMMPRYF